MREIVRYGGFLVDARQCWALAVCAKRKPVLLSFLNSVDHEPSEHPVLGLGGQVHTCNMRVRAQ